MDAKGIRDVVRELYPGEENKALRNAIYKEPGFLDSDPGDQQIHALAAKFKDQPASEVAPEQESPFGLVDTSEDPYPEVKALVASLPPLIVVATATDYTEADKWFSA